jgi:hypothetical protein
MYGREMAESKIEDRIVFDFFCVGCCIFEMVRWTDANETNDEFKRFSETLMNNEHFCELNIWANYSVSFREFVQLTLFIMVADELTPKTIN